MAFGFLKNIVNKFHHRSVDWDDLEEILIRADLGVPLTLYLIEQMREKGSELKAETVIEITRRELLNLFPAEAPATLLPDANRPKVILLLAVNGTGKTTTAAKLGHYFLNQQQSVLFAAADTFRAAAIEQLVHWGKVLNVEVIRGQYQGDPSALCYDAYNAAASRNIDFLLCDTAGRLHTKKNLMQELGKMVRTLGKHHPILPDEKWIVIDATTGMNGLIQAKEFHAAVGLTGVIITKVDGSGRGGIAAAIQHELGLTPRFLGFGEKPEDLRLFDRISYVEQLV